MSSPTRRFRLLVHYDGSRFHGWQVQPDVPTVQGRIEAVLEQISGAPRTLHGSGRTDTGVHAIGQVAAVDLPSRWEAERVHAALNALLPDGIWIEAVTPTPPGFHPRFDALDRTYHYRLGIDRRAFSPFHRPFCWPLRTTPDLDVMQGAALALPGDHSFVAFAKAGQPERGERCTVHRIEWVKWEMGVEFRITANRYLHHMVRYLVGTLVEIGIGARPAGDLASLLHDPASGLVTSPPAPPEGLFLARVRYD
ncbi:MAG: tRNA pseudouridine(38-40) synthase TruA [Longimicrobiales bacterium]|nr:tRNA pseudouridine(38-40) synthase TruA [Longimicrobiales bacterium]